MSQRNPMNERYTTDKHAGTTRKSAASAKPKNKAAATVTYGTTKKKPKDRKAEKKAKRKEEAALQRELDRKYYKPDTERYKKLRKIWWGTLIGAVACTALSWALKGIEPSWIAMVFLAAAYLLIILAFYIDFSKIRKERREYQSRMLALEIEQKKAKEAEERAMLKKENSKRKRGKRNTSTANTKNETSAKDEE